MINQAEYVYQHQEELIKTFESALRQIEQISLEKMKSSEKECSCDNGKLIFKNDEGENVSINHDRCQGTGIICDETWKTVNEICVKALWPV